MTLVPQKTLSRLALFALGVLAALSFRLAVARNFSTSTPDGDQYLQLSQSLVQSGTLAFGPPPSPPSYSRLPGYPLFLALFDRAPRSHADHVQRAAIVNALLDVATALLAFLLLRDWRQTAAGVIAQVAIVLFPLMLFFSTHVLTESVATFLTTFTIWLASRAHQRRALGYAAAAGAVAGVALLVRSDCLTVVLACAVLLALAKDSAARLRLGVAFTLALLVVYSPWPIRNLRQFGAPHFEATEWLRQDGTPLPTGPIKWMRTWSTGLQGESTFADLLVFNRPFRAASVLRPQMFDDPAERELVTRLVDRAGAAGLTPDINLEFESLARSRSHSHPWRSWIVLPLQRMWRTVSPPPRDTVRWARISLLGLPENYWMFPWSQCLGFALAAVGLVIGLRSKTVRPLALGLATAVGARLAIHSFAVPHYAGPRYLVEVVPAMMVFAALAAVVLARELRRVAQRRSRAQS